MSEKKTEVVRVPQGVYESARRIAGLQGRQAGDLLGEAWDDYLATHREQFAADFEEAARMLREGDSEGLMQLASRTVQERVSGRGEEG